GRDRGAPSNAADGVRTAGSSSFFPISLYGITRWTDCDERRIYCGRWSELGYGRGITEPAVSILAHQFRHVSSEDNRADNVRRHEWTGQPPHSRKSASDSKSTAPCRPSSDPGRMPLR